MNVSPQVLAITNSEEGIPCCTHAAANFIEKALARYEEHREALRAKDGQ